MSQNKAFVYLPLTLLHLKRFHKHNMQRIFWAFTEIIKTSRKDLFEDFKAKILSNMISFKKIIDNLAGSS